MLQHRMVTNFELPDVPFFEGRTEYVQGYDTPQHTYPLGSLVFGVLDLDTAPYLERGRTLLENSGV